MNAVTCIKLVGTFIYSIKYSIVQIHNDIQIGGFLIIHIIKGNV